MNLYANIIDPGTGQSVSISDKRGREILANYIDNWQYGGCVPRKQIPYDGDPLELIKLSSVINQTQEVLDAIQVLIDACINLNNQDDDGNTALMKAADAGHTVIINALISNGSNTNMTNNVGNTALYLAARRGRIADVRVIIQGNEVSTLINTTNNDGDTPLIAAVLQESVTCVRALIEAGAHVNIRNRSGIDAIEYCQQMGSRSENSSRILYLLRVGIDDNDDEKKD